MGKYREASEELAEDFFNEFQTGLFKVAENPRFFTSTRVVCGVAISTAFPTTFSMMCGKSMSAYGSSGTTAEIQIWA